MSMNTDSKCIEIRNLLDFVGKETKKSVAEIKAFLDKECINYSNAKKEIYKEHDIDNTRKFNFFESISDLYYRENFHSDILEILLNPNTREIGRKYFIEAFIAFLGLTNNEFDSNSDFEVIRECPTGEVCWKDDNGKQRWKEGYIDLLIKNDNQAIIIENKINYAPDMDNQLVRYMKFVNDSTENGGLNISKYTVVYLTLTENKNPPMEFDKEFEKYAMELKNPKILKHVCAVADKKNRSLENSFLPACQELLRKEMDTTENIDVKQSCNTANVYIEQYRTLLKHLGGNEYMKSADVQILREVYSSKEKFDAFNDLKDLIEHEERLGKALEEVIKERFVKEISEEVVHEKRHNWDAYYSQNKNKTLFVYFLWDSKYKEYFQIGCTPLDGNKFSDEEQKRYLEIMKKIPFNEYPEIGGEEWVYCYIKKDEPCFIDNVLNGLKILYNGK